MKALCYLMRKNGIHGFLKLVDTHELEDKDCTSYQGREIHFRTIMKLHEAVQRAFGAKYDSQGKPLGLFLKNKPRKIDLVDCIEIARGEDSKMDALWTELLGHAKEVDARRNVMERYDVNCHTLSFEVLERANLKAPRHIYHQKLAEIKEQEQIMHGSPVLD